MTTFNVSTTAAFQTALGQAQAGDSILLAPGTYAGISIQNVAKSGAVTISSQNLSNPAVLEQFSISNSSGLSFSHLAFTAVGSTDSAYVWRVTNSSNISWDSLTVTGNPSLSPATNPTAFLIQNSSNMSITNSSFSGLLTGIIESVSNHMNFTGNSFQQMGTDGIDSAQVSFVTIDNNTFTNFAPAAGAHPDAIQFWTVGTTAPSHDITISGNVYERGANPASTDSQGIFLSDELGNMPYSNVTITNNTILGSMYNGIMLVDGLNSTIANNTVAGYSDMESWIRVVNSKGVALSNNAAEAYVLTGNTNVTETSDRTIAAATPTTTVTAASPPPPPPPTLSNSGPTMGYDVGGQAVSVAQALAVTDTAKSTLASASVAITGGFLAGDALNFANQNGITGAYNATTGVLTLTGTASLAAYQTALDSVTYSSSAADPTKAGADLSRAVSFTVNDGAHSSNSLASAITVAVWSLSPLHGGMNSSAAVSQVATAQSVAPATTSSAINGSGAAASAQIASPTAITAGGDAFILGSAGQAAGHIAALSSTTVSNLSDLGGLGTLSFGALAARAAPLNDSGALIAGDIGLHHHTDFVLPMLGMHSSGSHSLLM